MKPKPYRPSNGTEGTYFEEEHCMQCIHTDPDPNGEKQCQIWMNAICHSINEPEYPKEWCYVNEKPTCTNWQKWDWGDGDDRNEPPADPQPPSSDPNQLMIPYSVWDLLGIESEILVTPVAVLEAAEFSK